MPTLAGIDTTKVYHEFDFDCHQVKDLKLQQYFIHSHLDYWFEKILANRFREFNFIEIIYKRLHHFDINHVKCVEIYYGEHDVERFQHFKSEMDLLLKNAQYKMPWRSATIFNVRKKGPEPNYTFDDYTTPTSNKLQISEIEDQLLKNDHLLFLIKRYSMEVDWCQKHNLTVFEFLPNLNKTQLNRLKYILRYYKKPSTFIFEEFMFLKTTKPPSVLYSRVLTVYHGQFLSSLTLEDILSLELANKDYRLESYDSDLDRDIQMHLKNRFNLLNKHKKLGTYDATEFTNATVLKYFLYKYRDCFTTVELPNYILTKNDFDLIVDEHKNINFNTFNTAIRYDIISPKNITVCSVTLQRHRNGNIIEPDFIITREIRLDSDISFSFEDEILSGIGYPPYFIEISIQANCKSVRLTDFLHTVLGKINNRDSSDSIIQLSSYNNRISNFILKSFVERIYALEISFKNITFDFTRLVKWLRKCSRLRNVSFTDCTILFSDERFKILRFMLRQRSFIDCCDLKLTFRNMMFDIKTFSKLIQISRGEIIYDGCCLTPSSSTIIPPKSLKCVVCKNMKIDLEVLTPLLPHFSFEFDNCQIQSNHDPILQDDSMAKSLSDHKASFEDMDIDAEVLLNISVYICYINLDHCRILSNVSVYIPSKYPTNYYATIDMVNVEIELKAAVKTFNRFGLVKFTRSSFVSTDLPTLNTPVKSNSDFQVFEISITSEFIKCLKYLDLRNSIYFSYCPITNQNLLEIWAAAPRCKYISISDGHLIDYYFNFELVSKIYENRFEEMLHELKHGVAISIFKLFDIKWSENPTNHRQIDWHSIQIRSVRVNDVTIKLEYIKNDEVLDLFYEQNNLLNDSDICEVNYC